MDYFISDFHIGHANVIKFDNRPYENVKQMDDHIIKVCMSTLKPKDNFYYLGDWGLCHTKHLESTISTVASSGANLFFIKGNHDKKDTLKLYEKYGTYLGEQKKIKIQEQEIVLNHFAMRIWDKRHHGSWHLYGHSHHSLPEDPNSLSFDVGWNGYYKLLDFDYIKFRMSKKRSEVIDHHK